MVSHVLKRRLLVDAQRVGDLLVLNLSLAVAFVLAGPPRDVLDIGRFLAARVKLGDFVLLAVQTVAWYLIFRSQGLYRSSRLRTRGAEWAALTRAVAVGTLSFCGLAVIFGAAAVNGAFVAIFFGAAWLGTMGTRLFRGGAARYLRNRGRNLRTLIIVGCGPRGARLGAQIRRQTGLGYHIIGYVDDLGAPVNPASSQPEELLGSLRDIGTVLERHEVDEVFVALPIKSCYDAIATTITACEEMGVTVHIPAADFFPYALSRANVDALDEVPIISLQTPRPSLIAHVQKRALDVLVSSIALLSLLPLLAAAALAIKLDSPGPVFFCQQRVGRGRRRFRILKFRTMVVDAEAQLLELEARNEVSGAAFKMKNDPRITRVGRFLRQFSIDELPQFWNVLMGDMSLVGPRPLPVRDVEAFRNRWQKRRFSVAPGITCLWQAGGRHDLSFEDWMKLDLEYIDNWSLGLDLWLLLKTVPAVVRGTGAY